MLVWDYLFSFSFGFLFRLLLFLLFYVGGELCTYVSVKLLPSSLSVFVLCRLPFFPSLGYTRYMQCHECYLPRSTL